MNWFEDVMYPRCTLFIFTVFKTLKNEEKVFHKMQGERSKDIERAIAILQEKWQIIARPSMFLTVDHREDVMKT